MTGHGAKFARKKEEAIFALLTHRTIEEAARSIGIDPKTLLRWMKEPEFDKAYRAAKRAAFGQSIARLHHLSSAAAFDAWQDHVGFRDAAGNQSKGCRQYFGPHDQGDRDRRHRRAPLRTGAGQRSIQADA
jgi:hypothetical protein